MSDPSHRAHSVQTQQPAPEMIRFRDLLADAYGQHPPLHTLSIQAARAVAEIVRAPWASGGPTMLETRDHLIESGGLSLRLRVHRPKQEPDGVLVYVHGGGWTLFSMDTHDRVMREYAGRAGIAVVGIDYTLVPEAVFPRQVDEVTALVRLLRQPDAQDWLGFDPIGLPIAIGGDSAGGNLAMATALTLRDAGEIDYLQAVILNYAVVDTDETRPSYRRY
ncbi:MAG: alpha/beta hydrolase fold domain-containing protein, partial [Janthinobacterium lividum]